MAKIRVYELAKELGLESKQLISFLSRLGVEVKNHMSTLEDDEISKVKAAASGKGRPEAPRHQPEGEHRTAPTGQTQKPAGPGQQPSGTPGHRPPMQGQGQRPPMQGQGQRPPMQGQGQRPPMQGQGQRPPMQGQGQRPPYGQGQRPPMQGQGQRPPMQGQGQRPPMQGQGQRPPMQGQGQRPPYGQGQRPPMQGQGQRPPMQGQGQRPPMQGQGQRPPYGQGQGQGQRPPYGQGQRPPMQGQGQRPPMQGQGQRPPYGQGQRPPMQGQGQRPPYGQGQRPGGPGQGFRPQGPGQRPGAQGGPRGGAPGARPADGQRPGMAIPKPAQPAAGAPDQINRQEPKKDRNKDWDRIHKNKEKERLEQKLMGNKNAAARNQKGKRPRVNESRSAGTLPPKQVKPIEIIGDTISVKELASKMSKPSGELIKKLMGLGVMTTINQEIDIDTATLLAGDFGFEIDAKVDEADFDFIEEIEDAKEDLLLRPAVVTVMGHVDHGKTSLLDAIREANVTASEAGGITQHIGAYQVVHDGKKITFLDTPGHEAFTAMRARGAQATDIVVLVVAADDGVMPQTIEAINHSKAAGVPIIVAINKMDKPDAKPDRVKQELTEHGLVVEEWGGETIAVPVSAKSREGIDSLLEMILLVAEVQELKANPKRLAKGTVVEAELDKGRGPVATILVQTGTLEIGDSIIAGRAAGKVRAMIDDKGKRVKKAGPSTPVEVLGLSDVPEAGDIFHAVKDEKTAKQIAMKRTNKKREEEFKTTAKVSLEDLFKQIQEGQVKDLNIIIKADVQGSIEALRQSLAKLSTDEVRVNPIHGGVGAIKESDIMLASASNAIVIGFNVLPDANARRVAEAENVDVRLYRVIYNAIEDVKAAMSGLLDPEFKEVVIGRLEVRQLFKVSKVGTIAGSYVTEGKITKAAQVRVIRDNIIVHEGKLDSLKRFKDDVKEVAEGYECGIMVENFNDLQEQDVIEAFVMEEVERSL